MIELKKTETGILSRSENIPIYGEYDVAVVGGGMAGTGAGLAAAKRGCRTIIIEALSALGGLATLGLVNIPIDFICGLNAEMLDELEKIDAHWHRNTDPEKHKLVLDRMIKKYNCDVLLVTSVVDTIMDGDTVCGVIIQTKTGREAILAKRVVDASGDSDAVYYAGGEYMAGRPGDGISQGCSLEFILAGVDWDTYINSELKRDDVQWLGLIQKALDAGDLPYAIDNHLNWITHLPGRPQHCGKDEVSICLAHSRNCYPNSNKDLTRMYMEGREQAVILARFIKEYIPGFKDAYLSYTGSLLGVRESRRIVGGYMLTGDDIAYSRRHDDVIAISAHGFDIHNYDGPGNIKWYKGRLPDGREAYISNRSGFGTKMPPDDGLPRINMKELSNDEIYYYDIPYRCMVPVRLENLLAAGRNLSCDIVGQSGCRLVLLCFTLGEVAGTAMAMSIAQGLTPRRLDRIMLQKELIADGVNIGQDYRKIPGLI